MCRWRAVAAAAQDERIHSRLKFESDSGQLPEFDAGGIFVTRPLPPVCFILTVAAIKPMHFAVALKSQDVGGQSVKEPPTGNSSKTVCDSLQATGLKQLGKVHNLGRSGCSSISGVQAKHQHTCHERSQARSLPSLRWPPPEL